MATPLAPDVSGRNHGAPVALVAFLTALATAIGASRAHFVARAPDNTAAVSRTPEPVSDREKSSIDQAAHKWLAGSHTKAVRVTVAGAGLVDIAAVRDDTGEVRGALLVARDVDAAPDAASALVEVELGAALVSSVLDAPPAVAARQALIDWASSQSGRRTAFAVSIDRLGIANEVLGYRAGDAVLSSLVERIERWAGQAGRIARVGGARYLAIRTDLANEAQAVESAEQLRELIAGPVELDGLGVSRSASIGVATDGDAATTPAVLLAKAVVSGAAARAAGGDAVHQYYDAAATARLNQLRLELELHDALVAGQLRVHYQPELDLRTGRIVAVEALLRWEHPQRGLLGADSFVPYAEQSHTFTAVQHWVVDETCRQLAHWTRAGAGAGARAGAADGLVMRVNVSAAQILHGAITPILVSAIERNHLRGDQICVEITERRMPAELSLLAKELAGWRDRGITVAIDDFGTGEGTLSHLLTLPFDVIKLDQMFVGRMRGDARAAAVVAGVVSLAQSLSLEVVAEGVDGPDTTAELVKLGCLRGQGNALAEAMPPKSLEDLLRKQGDMR